jgi:hypothetical protein
VVTAISFLPRAGALPSVTGGSTADRFLATNRKSGLPGVTWHPGRTCWQPTRS